MRKYIKELETKEPTNYMPQGEPPHKQMMIWTGKLWLHWRGGDEGCVVVYRTTAQDWLRSHGHLAHLTRDEVRKEHDSRRAKFVEAMEYARTAYIDGRITRQEVVEVLEKELEK